jgi:uncharacterized protein HemY
VLVSPVEAIRGEEYNKPQRGWFLGVYVKVRALADEQSAHRVWAQALAAATPPRWDEAEAHMATSLRALESPFRPPTRGLPGGQVCRDRQDTATALDHLGRAADQFAASQLDDELRQARRLITTPKIPETREL